MIIECDNCGEEFEADQVDELYCDDCVQDIGEDNEDNEEVDEEDDEY